MLTLWGFTLMLIWTFCPLGWRWKKWRERRGCMCVSEDRKVRGYLFVFQSCDFLSTPQNVHQRSLLILFFAVFQLFFNFFSCIRSLVCVCVHACVSALLSLSLPFWGIWTAVADCVYYRGCDPDILFNTWPSQPNWWPEQTLWSGMAGCARVCVWLCINIPGLHKFEAVLTTASSYIVYDICLIYMSPWCSWFCALQDSVFLMFMPHYNTDAKNYMLTIDFLIQSVLFFYTTHSLTYITHRLS